MSAADNIAEMTPFLLTFSVARGSAKRIFAVIDRLSNIDPINSSGDQLNPSDVNGDIEFKNVCFSYPSRPDVQVYLISRNNLISLFDMLLTRISCLIFM